MCILVDQILKHHKMVDYCSASTKQFDLNGHHAKNEGVKLVKKLVEEKLVLKLVEEKLVKKLVEEKLVKLVEEKLVKLVEEKLVEAWLAVVFE